MKYMRGFTVGCGLRKHLQKKTKNNIILFQLAEISIKVFPQLNIYQPRSNIDQFRWAYPNQTPDISFICSVQAANAETVSPYTTGDILFLFRPSITNQMLNVFIRNEKLECMTRLSL